MDKYNITPGLFSNHGASVAEAHTTIQRVALPDMVYPVGQFQVTVISRFCYVLLCNHEYIHCLNHRQAKDYITRHNETERKL